MTLSLRGGAQSKIAVTSSETALACAAGASLNDQFSSLTTNVNNSNNSASQNGSD